MATVNHITDQFLSTNNVVVSALTVVGTISTSNHGTSDQWNQAYNVATTYQSNSALLTPLTLTNTLTGQLVLNTDFNSYKTNVASATASNINYVHTNFLPLTGGTVNGEISANNTIYDATGNSTQWNQAYNVATTYQSNSAITTGRTIYVDSVRGTDTRTGLSKYDIGKPFATIAAAVAASTFSPADLVWVRNGAYTISSQINLGSTPLNVKGNIYFEPSTTVTIPDGITAFSFTTDNVNFAVSIDGGAVFIIAGQTGGILTKAGSSTLNCTFKAVLDPLTTSTKTLFNCTGGVLFVNADLVNAPSSTCFKVDDSQGIGSRMSVRIPYVTGRNIIDASGTSTDIIKTTFTGDFWSLVGNNGIPISIKGSVNPSISITSGCVNDSYDPNTTPVVLLSSNDTSVGNGATFRSGTIFWSNNSQPNILIDGPGGSSPRIYFMSSVFQTESNIPSISASFPRDVIMTTCFANNSATDNITIRGGSLLVDSIF